MSSTTSHSATENTTSSLSPHVPEAREVVLSSGPGGEEVSELLDQFVHPHRHGTEDTIFESDDNEGASDDEGKASKKIQLPWWKRPSPWWLLAMMPFTSIAMSATIAPRIEIYTMLACSVHQPDIFRHNFPGIEFDLRSSATSRLDFRAPSSGLPTSPDIYFPGIYPFLDSSPKNGSTIPPKTGNLCASDPVVQAAVAKLTAVIAAFMGILSCITTGWWGAFSDRHGRTRVMGISVLGLLFTDFNFIFVALFSRRIPGGYWFLLVGPIVEGSLGGMTTGVAAIHGYMADTTSESNRSRLFSSSLGLMFTGMAIGPMLGSLLIRFTGKTLSVFFAATTIHLVYTLLVWFILPESLSKKTMENAKSKYIANLLEIANEREQNPAVGVLVTLKRAFTFLSPLALFTPEEQKDSSNPLKKPKMDWNLTLMVLGYAFTVSLVGSYSSKFQYAASAFGWDSQTIGYWLSLVGATRAIFLAMILPITIKLFKPEPIILELPVPTTPGEHTPLLDGNDSHSGSRTPSSPSTQAPNIIKKEVHSPSFDLNLARASLVVDIISYTFMGLAPTATAFTLFGMLSALGAGFNPAVQSVTLALYSRRGGTEIGRLFGALSVVQALCSQILGPTLYGFIYVQTVATYPRTIFFVSVVSVVISLVLLSFVRLPNASEYHRQSLLDLEEPTLAVDHIQEGTLVQPEPGEDASLNKTVAGLPSYGAAAKPPSIRSVH